METAQWALVAGAGLVAGAVNAIAGGGTLVTFPALLATGMAPVTANITSSVGLLAGYLGGSVGYRRELQGQGRRARSLAVVSVVGGVLGAVLLLATPEGAFEVAVPYLILLSCALLAAQPRLARLVAARRETQLVPAGAAAGAGAAPGADAAERRSAEAAPAAETGTGVGAVAAAASWPVKLGVLVSAVYGSYFGAGLGVLLLGVLGILVHDHLQRLNALKGLLSLVVNLVGVLVFVASGRVAWAVAAVLAVAAYTGGLLGVRVARVLPARVLRAAVVVAGVVVAVILLVRS